MAAVLGAHGLQAVGYHPWSDILLLLHKADEHILIGQFLIIALGHESVEHVVVLYCGMRADGLKAAVVIGEDQSVRTHNHSGTVAGEVDDTVLQRLFPFVERAVRHEKAFGFHLVVDGLRQIVECPHAFVSMCRQGCAEAERECRHTGCYTQIHRNGYYTLCIGLLICCDG